MHLLKSIQPGAWVPARDHTPQGILQPSYCNWTAESTLTQTRTHMGSFEVSSLRERFAGLQMAEQSR